jgi:hypothetical protein
MQPNNNNNNNSKDSNTMYGIPTGRPDTIVRVPTGASLQEYRFVTLPALPSAERAWIGTGASRPQRIRQVELDTIARDVRANAVTMLLLFNVELDAGAHIVPGMFGAQLRYLALGDRRPRLAPPPPAAAATTNEFQAA